MRVRLRCVCVCMFACVCVYNCEGRASASDEVDVCVVVCVDVGVNVGVRTCVRTTGGPAPPHATLRARVHSLRIQNLSFSTIAFFSEEELSRLQEQPPPGLSAPVGLRSIASDPTPRRVSPRAPRPPASWAGREVAETPQCADL
ncbi:hypothetical protein EVAR_581_1 [Eumeta japonica]|uniref:Secreted protein n=1 Tax=Eumeta variegata TaxID=151549 RepID=A0A4C1SB63_EUMVA|nr:hypothetical protein EVAR_581_1 [Eumeta japonica]